MSATSDRSIKIAVQEDVLVARKKGRDMARDMGFGSTDQTRLATAISEITRNVLKYAGTGICNLSTQFEHKTAIINVEIIDNGPGISDLAQAMSDGYSTGRSLGIGLPGTKRLVKDFEIESRPGLTKVSFSMSIEVR